MAPCRLVGSKTAANAADVEEGAERIARSLWTPVPSQVSHGGRAWVFRFARPGVISTGWMGVGIVAPPSLAPDKDPSGEIETLTTFPRWSGSFLCEGTRAAPQRYMDQAGWVLFRKPEPIRRRDPGVKEAAGVLLFFGSRVFARAPEGMGQVRLRVRLSGQLKISSSSVISEMLKNSHLFASVRISVIVSGDFTRW